VRVTSVGEPLRSALFVDFDNLFCGLGGSSAEASAFARRPGRWVSWLAAGGARPGGPRRRFLLQVCYLSPEVHGEHRDAFVQAGFRVVDCPALTRAGKNSADIHLVLDAVDALASTTRYDDVVVASSDADFTPLLHRFRAQDRRTTIVTAGPCAPAYRAVCDNVVERATLVEMLLSGDIAVPALRPVAAVASTRAPGAVPMRRKTAAEKKRDAGVAAAVAAVRDLVAASPVPVASGAAASAAHAAYPGIAATSWAGWGTFTAFFARHLPELAWSRQPGPGRVYDPARHVPPIVAAI
jgi:hypothetical protein